MASKPRDLVVRFLADTREFLRSTASIERAYDDMARDADHVADEGERSATRLARAYDRAGDEIRADARKTGADSAKGFGEAGKEAGDEFAQNLGESISSGDISGLLAGTAGGLAGTFGKAGPIALGLTALGGVAAAVFQGIQQAAEDAAQAAQAAYDDIASKADSLATAQTQLETGLGKGGWVANLAEAKRLAAEIGISTDTVVETIKVGNRQGAGYLRLQRELATLNDKAVRAGGELTNAEERRRLALSDLLGAADASADALQRARDAAAVTARLAAKTADSTGQTADNADRTAAALKAASRDYAKLGSSYAVGGSTYNSQVPRYRGGARTKGP
jgi:hypothetical protein